MTISPKQKLIISTTAITLSFLAGILASPSINRAIIFTTDLFATPQTTYMAKPSEYEARTTALFNSPQFKASCLAGARSQVALEIAREKKQEASYYLDQYDKESSLSVGIFETTTPSYIVATVASSSTTK